MSCFAHTTGGSVFDGNLGSKIGGTQHTLERDLKSPTLNKLAELCEVMEIHPLTLLTLAYAGDSTQQADQLLMQVRRELEAILKERDAQ